MAFQGPINIPTIRGRISERLRRAPARNSDIDEALSFPDSPGDVLLRSADERGVVALACLILENLREHGGTRASQHALESVLHRVLATFGPKEVMDLEVEAYELLLWLGKAIDPEWGQQQDSVDSADIDPHSSVSNLIRWAIATHTDLEMGYYSRGRGELTKRRITPISLEAETYLHAYCHLRRDERVFRLSRMAEVYPAGGWHAIKKKKTSSSSSNQPSSSQKNDKSPTNSQMSLLDD